MDACWPWAQASPAGSNFCILVPWSVMPLFKECWDTENIKTSFFFFIQEGSPADSHTTKFKQRGRRSGYDNKHLLLDEEKFTGALQVKYKYLDTPKRTEKIRLWIKLYCDSLLFNETNGWAKFFFPKWCIYMPGYFLFHSLSNIPSSMLKRTVSFRKSGLSVVRCDCAVSLFISYTDALQGLWLAWDHKWVCGAKKTLPRNFTESKKRNKNPERRHS